MSRTRRKVAISNLESRSTGEKGAVDGVDDRLSADLAATEEATVEAFDGILTARDAVEFEVDVALGIGI